jgi:hypothetical protein
VYPVARTLNPNKDYDKGVFKSFSRVHHAPESKVSYQVIKGKIVRNMIDYNAPKEVPQPKQKQAELPDDRDVPYRDIRKIIDVPPAPDSSSLPDSLDSLSHFHLFGEAPKSASTIFTIEGINFTLHEFPPGEEIKSAEEILKDKPLGEYLLSKGRVIPGIVVSIKTNSTGDPKNDYKHMHIAQIPEGFDHLTGHYLYLSSEDADKLSQAQTDEQKRMIFAKVLKKKGVDPTFESPEEFIVYFVKNNIANREVARIRLDS